MIRGSNCISSGSTAWYDMYDTIRHNMMNRDTIQHIHKANPAQYNPMHSTIRTAGDTTQWAYAQYDTTRYELRVICLQNNTYMYGKPCTVHMILGTYCISSGVQYGTIRTARMLVANRDILFTIRDIFFFAPRFFMIGSTVRTIFPREKRWPTSLVQPHIKNLSTFLISEIMSSAVT
jgi:hypothetical protein